MHEATATAHGKMSDHKQLTGLVMSQSHKELRHGSGNAWHGQSAAGGTGDQTFSFRDTGGAQHGSLHYRAHMHVAPMGVISMPPPLRECKSHGQLGAPGLSPANTQRPARSHTPKAGRGHSGDGDQSEQLCGLTLKFGRRHGQCPLPDGFQHHLAGERRGKTIFQEKIPAAINTNTPVSAYKLHADTHVT